MLTRSPLSSLAFLPLLALPLFMGACGGGCSDPSLQCDANGENCVICDAYGCSPADSIAGSGGAGASGQGANGQGGDGQGGSGAQAGSGTGGEGGAGCDPALTTCACEDGSCPADLDCIDGLCLSGCNHSFECGPGKVCANGQCAVGCDQDTPCAQPGTTCDKGVCVADPDNPLCDDDNPCPAPETCVGGLCFAECAVHADCDDGFICNSITGACMPDPSPTPLCNDQTTCPGVGQVCWSDGYCRYTCQNLQECKLIDNRFEACDAGICKTEEEIDPECDLQTPCPAGQDCISNHCL
jgi:hypothetical protein